MSKYYITTAIPYVNAVPHIGTAMDFIYADVLARHNRQIGVEQVLFSTGVDEHGTKIAEKAKEAGQSPEEFANQTTQKFIEVLKILNISNDRFIRTTDSGHEQRAQIVWNNLSKDIYKNKYVGLYCVGCEEYVTETTAKANNMICPEHNRPYERIEEENYFFSLSKYAETIKNSINDDSFHIVPSTRKHEILSLIESGLDDISISRPIDKLAWGIPVPDDKTQVMYVWFEALLNYITVLGYPDNKDFETYWPADMQVIGKGVLRFHAAMWPGILLALGLPLPKTLFVHGYINIEGKKISKSLGNVVSPIDIIKKYGVDATRYYLMRHIPSYDDGDFTWEKMEDAYNNELANDLGNAVQRVASMIDKYQNKLIGDIPPPSHDIHEYQEAIAHCRFDKALDEVWEQIRGLNQYIDAEKPWVVAKTNDIAHLGDILSYSAGCLLEIAALVRPFMPDTAGKIEYAFKEGILRSLDKSLFPKED
ncbi:MAG: methionine--tRNA ligase [Candidatus Saccharibacteria bacterium]